MADKMLDKLSKILKQAENAGTPEEAEVFMKKAQMLATTHSIDLALARQHTAKTEQREQPVQKWITIGESRKGNNAHYCELFLSIASTNDVKLDLANNNTFVVAYGMPSDIEVVEVLYASLLFQMVEAANEWLKTGAYKEELVYRTVTKRDSFGPYKSKAMAPLHGKTARANFYKAFTSRVQTRLADARQEALESAKEHAFEVIDEDDNVVSTTAEIVLRSKAVEIRDFHSAKSTAKGSWKGSSQSTYSGASRAAGDSAGRSARLGGQKAIGGSRPGIAA